MLALDWKALATMAPIENPLKKNHANKGECILYI
jgi:hypothetical protein